MSQETLLCHRSPHLPYFNSLENNALGKTILKATVSRSASVTRLFRIFGVARND